jgi:hypothetical protein
MADAKRITLTLLFVRCYKSKDRKKSWLYQEIDPSENDGTSLDYKDDRSRVYGGKNLCAGLRPGAIVAVEAEEENQRTIYPASTTIAGQWENDDDVVRWRSLDRAVQGEIESEQAAAKKVKRDLPAEQLAPFRNAYQACSNKKQCAQLLAWVIEEITTYRP